VLADPRILILDEATSSLDSESEALISERPEVAHAGTHHFRDCPPPFHGAPRPIEFWWVESGGKIVERGTHQSLYDPGEPYYELYATQHGLEADLLLAPGESGKGRAGGEAGGERGRRRPSIPCR